MTLVTPVTPVPITALIAFTTPKARTATDAMATTIIIAECLLNHRSAYL